MANKKIYILTVLLAMILLFAIAFNFSSAFTGAERQALIESLIKQIIIIKEKILEIQRQLLLLISSQIQQKQQSTNIIPPVSYNELNISSTGAKTPAEYYEAFLKSVASSGFTQEELSLIQKNEEERALLLEELIDQAILFNNQNELWDSFLAWYNFDNRVIEELKKINVDSSTASLHQRMIGWYKYHAWVAKEFSKEETTKTEMLEILDQFKKNADTHNSRFQNSLVGIEESPNFTLISQAQAFTCGAFMGPFYHFGGRVTLMKYCNAGIIETISPPCGGMLLFTYGVLAANPYLWKKPTYGSAVLGRSLVAPFVCPLGSCPACVWIPFEAIVLFFGTSLTP
ncbi:hypothetical protein KJ750_01280 [Patescibacteria group bacterium]|nr:hypothetical protein [Patescibacteria group bacterium]